MNNNRAFFVFIGLFLLLTIGGYAQVERTTDIVRVGSKDYYMHRIEQGETLYGLSKLYQVSIEEIERLNPEVKEGLKAGYVIGIPVVFKEVENQVIAEGEKQNPDTLSALIVGGRYVVQEGEDLYDIAKKFGIDVADFKAINPGLTNEPSAGMTIMVPEIENTDDYLVHKVEYNERTTTMLRRWKVSESDFREKNVSVGSHVFVNQIVLIPIEPVTVTVKPIAMDDDEKEIIVDEGSQEGFFTEDEPVVTPECDALPENASRRYKVALMVPLYLQDIGRLDVGKEDVAQARKSRSLSFLQYYEGFMMAVESLTQNEGLNLDLTVIDVTDNVASAHDAVTQIEGKDLDMIIGPFFGKSFEVVESYAKSHGIIVVNPLSTRESIIDGNPNVVKVKPANLGQIQAISHLVKHHYSDSNVFIISNEKDSDTTFLNHLEHQLNLAVNTDVTVTNEDLLRYAREESARMEMGSRMVSTVNVEGQVYATSDLQNGGDKTVVLSNPVRRYKYSSDGLGSLKSQLSGVRNNLIVAYGDDNVFATQVLNTMKKEADRFPITLVAAPDWTKFEKLLVENLLQMNAIYLSDFFVDYNRDDVKRFVRQFRSNYRCEPQEYAFEGYDIATYFLTALMRYGSDFMGCLPYFDMPLLHTHYRFLDHNRIVDGRNYGMENMYWSVFQYDNEDIELRPIDPFEKSQEE